MSKNVAPQSQGLEANPISEIRPSRANLARQLSEIEVSYEDEDMGPMPDFSRIPLDSSDMTHVKMPNPVLLAMARGAADGDPTARLEAIARNETMAVARSAAVKRPSRRTWFALGMLTGIAATWLLIGDVQPAAQAIHSLTTKATQTLDPAEGRTPVRDQTPASDQAPGRSTASH